MLKVLVTGANGYIGKHVVDCLLKSNVQVYALDHKNNNIDPRAEYLNLDIFSEDPNLYQKLGCPDVCIHLAWRDGFKHNSLMHMSELSKHFVFLSNLIEQGLPSLSVMGTMHEVGYWEGAIDENTPCRPLSQYGIAKNALRQSLEVLANQKQFIFHWLRAFYITGDEEHSKNIFSKIYFAAKNGQQTFPLNSGKNLYDFLDIDDLAKMIVSASLQSEISGTINCCSGKPISLASKVQEFIESNNIRIKLQFGAFPDRPYDSPGVWGDPEKITTIMNGRPL